MNYLPRNKNKGGSWKPVLALFAVFVLGILLHSFFSGAIITAVTPVWRADNFAAARLHNFAEFFKTKKRLAAENNSLRLKLAALELEAASRAAAAADFSPGRGPDPQGIPAAVLARPPQSPYDVFIIDAGLRDGVSVGARAYLPEGPLIGVVEDVFSVSSKVRLYSSPGKSFEAVLERHAVPVTLEGAGGGNFRIVVPRETEVIAGDRVLSADINSKLVAIVGSVSMEPTDSFKDVRAISPGGIFNPTTLIIRQR